ncbi:tyrosine--tRNA ligase [Natronomonas pharaonis DSM 2160]|uniref:Tyrosine--tRNA ligase n=1 Tax=Natronomonas pharaonis (strain ATCC 35678 / DSM 2160 / CIP 103997 / JCM 8858 / NBRC 14720 / NCIMB 2260 / Gabara) TaxID=348780 RepID=SYY_NATPD|nr:tyrosine--tRNA ligase [Natronomonas pharaonis]Q3IQU8.1 RecName: Full=Tyrosine--tRNA ligase; AltName: Full=Tyrosyl-tRNA synthetase; Short=TyrRS [Natronomonas pharaonis DSM 2160]CAI49496.1 tyrosine--tRNA ligase [Natronomonas pharaonis DSM 2160]
MDTVERTDLVARFTEEVIERDEIETLFEEQDEPTAYIGYAPTGEMHIGHFTTMRKLADFIDAGLDVTVLVADLHAHLDDAKSPFELLEARSEYYERAIEGMIAAAGADPDGISFIRGTDFQLDEPYTLDLYRLLADTTLSRAQRAGSEVVRQSENPSLGSLVYTLMQALDVAALDADIAYGGIDQRGIYMLAREQLPDHGYDKPACVFAPLLSGLSGGKMSASEAGSKINLTDDGEAIDEKIGGAYCPAGETEENGVLEYLEYLVFPVFDQRDTSFVVERPEKYGGDLEYGTYDELEADFVSGELHPADLKPAAAAAIDEVVAPVRELLLEDPELLASAYPERYE